MLALPVYQNSVWKMATACLWGFCRDSIVRRDELQRFRSKQRLVEPGNDMGFRQLQQPYE